MATHLPFHERLRYERELRGWSQADLAEKVRCDTKTIGRWERGVDDAEILWRPGWDETLPIDASFEVRLLSTEQ